MATRTRDSVPRREKPGTSPSHAPQTGGTVQQRRSPNTSKTSSPAKNHDSTTASTKNIPNYLKPTISSGVDASKQQGKRPVLFDGAHKPTLARRRSFDKPPSPSHPQKASISPGPTLRSSSFSGKTLASQKLVPERTLKTQRETGKQHHSMYGASAIKKSSIYAKKQGTESGTSTKKEKINNPPQKAMPDVPEPETQTEDKTSLITEAENNYGKNAEVPVPEDQEIMNIEQSEIENHNGADVATVEPHMVLEQYDVSLGVKSEEPHMVLEQQDVSTGVKSEEPEDKLHIDEIGSKEQELKHTTADVNVNVINENVAINQTEGVEKKVLEEISDKKEDEATGNELEEKEAQEVAEKEKQVPEKAEVDEKLEIENAVPEEKKEIENTAPEEKQETEDAAVEDKKKTENTRPKQQVAAHGKKESAVSNDVIEETASKLREQRKNKVRALAGAFETVISLQEPK